DTGGFLDIVLDFIFYASIPLGHVLANPQQNALAGAVILFAFIGTGSSFLAYAIFDAKRSPKAKQHTDEAYKKSFTYLAGLTEGSETIIFLVATCLLPDLFPWLAYGFAVLCTITTTGRILYSVRKLNES
ncbi:MAG: CDP-alcohol phosphatidyltransferase family protein, partial [Pseudomonadota bacterium]